MERTDSQSDELLTSKRRFWWRYFTAPAIQLYFGLAFSSFSLAVWIGMDSWRLLVVPFLVVVAYPFVEYGLHRLVLHDRRLIGTKLGSLLWKRIHFDHHRHPDDAIVLFGAPYTTIPLLVALTFPAGWFLSGWAGAFTGFGCSLVAFCYYEWAHCVAHFGRPNFRWTRRLRRRHLLHHYQDESGNFGIGTTIADSLFGTAYDTRTDRSPSNTVRNLGYNAKTAEKFPWVAQLTSDWGTRPEDE